MKTILQIRKESLRGIKNMSEATHSNLKGVVHIERNLLIVCNLFNVHRIPIKLNWALQSDRLEFES